MARQNNPLETNRTWSGIGRFLAVGTLGTLVDFMLFAALHTLIGIPALIANTISYSAGIVNNFILHRRWTFADREHGALGTQFTQFTIVSLSALILNNLLVLSLAPSFEVLFNLAGYGTLLAKICAAGVGVGWNYFANTFWTFRVAPQRAQKFVNHRLHGFHGQTKIRVISGCFSKWEEPIS